MVPSMFVAVPSQEQWFLQVYQNHLISPSYNRPPLVGTQHVPEPMTVKRNLFRSLPSGWTLRCCHQPENLWSNLEAVMHVFSLRLLENRAGFSLLRAKKCPVFIQKAAGWDRNEGTSQRAVGCSPRPMLQAGWHAFEHQVWCWGPSAAASDGHLQPSARGKSRLWDSFLSQLF